jgi:acetolactate synthase I/II/III large subunit
VTFTGAQSLIKSLEHAGVEVVFGIPGGTILPAYDPLLESSVRHILMRHEQGAGHAAEGYAVVTGKAGVCWATSGPGATNLVTPLADAFMDSVPLVAITGQVPRPVIGNDAFQEADITGITMPCTKHSFKVMDPEEIPQMIAEAFHIATTGRPGPVLVDIPKDVLTSQTSFAWPETLDLPGYRPTTMPNRKQIREAVDLIESAERPVLYVGGGVLKARASAELVALAELLQVPVVTTLMARGAIPDSHPLCLGMPGMHGTYAAVTAMQRSDLLINLGARFDDRVTGNLSSFAPDAKVIHADIDPAEIGKNRAVDVPIVGDAKPVIVELTVALKERSADPRPDRSAWLETVGTWSKKYPLLYDQPEDGAIKPQFVVDRFAEKAEDDTVCVTGVGQHQMWASQFFTRNEPYSFVTSGGLGTMGFGVPAAFGAKVGRPDARVVCIDGDGCFQMTAQELATAAIEKVPFIVAILNNSYLGMVRQWQELFYDERYSQVHLPQEFPDYVKLAEAYGCVGLRATTPDEVDNVIDKAMGVDDRPVVIDFRTDEGEMCFPMVPAGASNDDIMLDPRVDWEGRS